MGKPPLQKDSAEAFTLPRYALSAEAHVGLTLSIERKKAIMVIHFGFHNGFTASPYPYFPSVQLM